MSFLGKIFGQPAVPPAVVATSPNPGQLAAENKLVPNAAAPVSDGSVAAFPKVEGGAKSPLAEYGKLWEADANAPKLENSSLVPDLSFDPAKLLEAAKGIDFTKVMPPELLAKAAANDPAALAQVINLAAQAGVAQSAGTTAKLVTEALTKQQKVFEERYFPDKLREASSRAALQVDTLASNPAAAPVYEMVRSHLAAKFPTASPEAVANHAKTYMSELGLAITEGSGKQVVDPSKAPKPSGVNKFFETDFSNWDNEVLS